MSGPAATAIPPRQKFSHCCQCHHNPEMLPGSAIRAARPPPTSKSTVAPHVSRPRHRPNSRVSFPPREQPYHRFCTPNELLCPTGSCCPTAPSHLCHLTHPPRLSLLLILRNVFRGQFVWQYRWACTFYERNGINTVLWKKSKPFLFLFF